MERRIFFLFEHGFANGKLFEKTNTAYLKNCFYRWCGDFASGAQSGNEYYAWGVKARRGRWNWYSYWFVEKERKMFANVPVIQSKIGLPWFAGSAGPNIITIVNCFSPLVAFSTRWIGFSPRWRFLFAVGVFVSDLAYRILSVGWLPARNARNTGSVVDVGTRVISLRCKNAVDRWPLF